MSKGKKFFGIPSNIENTHNIGTHMVINKGAKLITQVKQILEELNFNSSQPKEFITQGSDTSINVDKEYLYLYKILTKTPINIEQIMKLVNKDIKHINSTLTMLELEGYIEQLPGKNFKLKE